MKIVSFMLKKLECDIVQAENGKEAVASFLQHTPDLILMDIHMPEMDGMEATREIRRIELEQGLNRVPISALSANDSQQIRLDAEAAGMDFFVSKPVKIETLSDLLKNLKDFNAVDSESEESHKESIFDIESLSAVFSGNREIVLSLLKEFLDGLPAMLDRIQNLTAQQDYPTLDRAAHSLKGQLLNLQAKEASKAYAALEQAAREGNKKAIEESSRICDNSMAVLTEKIKSYLTT